MIKIYRKAAPTALEGGIKNDFYRKVAPTALEKQTLSPAMWLIIFKHADVVWL